MKNFLLPAILIALIISACQKDVTNDLTLKGFWLVNKIVDRDYNSGTLLQEDVYNVNGGVTLNFKDDGKLVIIEVGQDTTEYDYTLFGTNLSFNGSNLQVMDLTPTSVTLFENGGGGPDRFEEYLYLTRQ